MPAGPDFRPRNSVKRHNGRLYWLTRDVSLGFVDFYPPGRILGTRTFRAAGVFRILPTHTFRVAGVLHFTYTHFSGGRGVAFYVHTLSGRLLSEIEKNDLKLQNISALRARYSLRNP